MTTLRFSMFNLLLFIVLAVISGCKKDDNPSGSDENFGYEYYKGAIPNSYYMNNFLGERALKVTGKPFMVVKYDRVSHHILDFEFGLSEVTQSRVASATIGNPPQPLLSSSSIDYNQKLGLTGSVDLLVNWPVTGWGGTVTNGSLDAGGVFFTHTAYGCKWSFSYLPAGSMTGGVTMVNDDASAKETDSESSFNLSRF